MIGRNVFFCAFFFSHFNKKEIQHFPPKNYPKHSPPPTPHPPIHQTPMYVRCVALSLLTLLLEVQAGVVFSTCDSPLVVGVLKMVQLECPADNFLQSVSFTRDECPVDMLKMKGVCQPVSGVANTCEYRETTCSADPREQEIKCTGTEVLHQVKVLTTGCTSPVKRFKLGYSCCDLSSKGTPIKTTHITPCDKLPDVTASILTGPAMRCGEGRFLNEFTMVSAHCDVSPFVGYRAYAYTCLGFTTITQPPTDFTPCYDKTTSSLDGLQSFDVSCIHQNSGLQGIELTSDGCGGGDAYRMQYGCITDNAIGDMCYYKYTECVDTDGFDTFQNYLFDCMETDFLGVMSEMKMMDPAVDPATTCPVANMRKYRYSCCRMTKEAGYTSTTAYGSPAAYRPEYTYLADLSPIQCSPTVGTHAFLSMFRVSTDGTAQGSNEYRAKSLCLVPCDPNFGWTKNYCNHCPDIYQQTSCSGCAFAHYNFPECTELAATVCPNGFTPIETERKLPLQGFSIPDQSVSVDKMTLGIFDHYQQGVHTLALIHADVAANWLDAEGMLKLTAVSGPQTLQWWGDRINLVEFATTVPVTAVNTPVIGYYAGDNGHYFYKTGRVYSYFTTQNLQGGPYTPPTAAALPDLCKGKGNTDQAPYLTTITSQEEWDFLVNTFGLVSNPDVILTGGVSEQDAAAKFYRWKTGIEKYDESDLGTSFWHGDRASGGDLGIFNAFGASYPASDSGYVVIKKGEWRDYDLSTVGKKVSYICEAGGLPGEIQMWSGFTVLNNNLICEVDECVHVCPTCNQGACETVGQTCNDPSLDPYSLSDWICSCPAPSTATHVAGAADCSQADECKIVAVNNTCSTVGQFCVDPDQGVSDDWTCSCVAPETGTAVTGNQAHCILDECTTTQVCANANQTCKDADTTVSSTGDWDCTCNDSSGISQRAAAASCPVSLDECTDPNNMAVCETDGQTCTDDDFFNLRTWYCECVSPLVGTRALTKKAVCVAADVNECTDTCPTCAGDTCETQGTMPGHCQDPNLQQLSDWLCICDDPATGSMQTAAAVCEMDECTAGCNTCQKDVCVNAGQSCKDPDVTVLNDWKCSLTCNSPATTVHNTGAPAVCPDVDECALPGGNICDGSGQVCEDTNFGTADTWLCKCKPPSTNEAHLALADCSFDECTEPCTNCENDACTNAGQTCVDTDLLAVGTWTCTCKAPATGDKQLGVAVCTLDECTVTTVCTDQDQDCSDMDTAERSRDDWVCKCKLPLLGKATAAAAACVLDECTQTCPTCEGGTTCQPAQQTCLDPDTSGTSIGDWYCACSAPQTGDSRATPTTAATCQFDECSDTNAPVCSGAETCFDSDLSAASSSDAVCCVVATNPSTMQRFCQAQVCQYDALTAMVPTDLKPIGISPLCAAGKEVARGANCQYIDSTPACVAYTCKADTTTRIMSWVEAPTCRTQHPIPTCANGTPLPCKTTVDEDSSIYEALSPTTSRLTVADVTTSLVGISSVCTCEGSGTATATCSAKTFNDAGSSGVTIDIVKDFVGTIRVDCVLTNETFPVLQKQFTIAEVLVAPTNDAPQMNVVADQAEFAVAGRPLPIDVLFLENVLPGPASALDETDQEVLGSCDNPTDAVSPPKLYVNPITKNAKLRLTIAKKARSQTVVVQCHIDDSGVPSLRTMLPPFTLTIKRVQFSKEGARKRSKTVHSDGSSITFALKGVQFVKTHPIPFSVAVKGSDPPEVLYFGGAPGVKPLFELTTDLSKEQASQGVFATAQKNANFIKPEIDNASEDEVLAGAQSTLTVHLSDPTYLAVSPQDEHLSLQMDSQIFAAPNHEDICDASLCSHDVTIESETPLPENLEVVQATTTSQIAFVASSSAGTKTGFLALVNRAMLCPGNGPEQLDRTLNPLGLAVGEGTYREYNGGTVGSIIMHVALLSLVGSVAVYFIQRYLHDIKTNPDHTMKWGLSYIFMKARVGWVVIPCTFLYGGAVLSSITCIIYSSIGYKVLGLMVILSIGLGFPVYSIMMVRKVGGYCEFGPAEHVTEKKNTVLRKVFWGPHSWNVSETVTGAHIWAMLHRHTFDAYKQRWRYFLSVELISLLCLAGFTAWQPTNRDGCWGRACGMTCSTGFFALALLVTRPYIAPYENVMEFGIAFSETVMLSCTMIAMSSGDTNPADHWAAKLSDGMGLYVVWLIMVKFVLDSVIFVIDEWEEWQHEKGSGFARFLGNWFFFIGVRKEMDEYFGHGPYHTKQSLLRAMGSVLDEEEMMSTYRSFSSESIKVKTRPSAVLSGTPNASHMTESVLPNSDSDSEGNFSQTYAPLQSSSIAVARELPMMGATSLDGRRKRRAGTVVRDSPLRPASLAPMSPADEILTPLGLSPNYAPSSRSRSRSPLSPSTTGAPISMNDNTSIAGQPLLAPRRARQNTHSPSLKNMTM